MPETTTSQTTSRTTCVVVNPATGELIEEAEGAYGPLSSRTAAEQLSEQIQDAVDKGATLHAGGWLGEGPTAFLAPAVLTGITEEIRAYREELSGPVAVDYKVGSDEEALALANNTQYGLYGAVFSTHPRHLPRQGLVVHDVAPGLLPGSHPLSLEREGRPFCLGKGGTAGHPKAAAVAIIAPWANFSRPLVRDATHCYRFGIPKWDPK